MWSFTVKEEQQLKCLKTMCREYLDLQMRTAESKDCMNLMDFSLCIIRLTDSRALRCTLGGNMKNTKSGWKTPWKEVPWEANAQKRILKLFLKEWQDVNCLK